MDISTFLSAVIGGIFTLAGAFVAIYLTSWLDRNKAAKSKRLEKIEAIGAYMPQLKRWYEEESRMYENAARDDYEYDPHPNKYDCPLYEIENLVNWWLPELREHVQAIGNVVSFFDDLGGHEGASEYQFGGNMEKLGSDMRTYHKIFKENYDYIWSIIGAEAQKAVPNRKCQPKGQLVA